MAGNVGAVRMYVNHVYIWSQLLLIICPSGIDVFQVVLWYSACQFREQWL